MALSQIPAWDSDIALNLQGPLHELHKNEVDILLKFDGEGNVSLTEHIRRYEYILCLFNVIHEDVACILFSITFESKDSLWFYFLPLNSISSWLEFKKFFIDSFEYYDII